MLGGRIRAFREPPLQLLSLTNPAALADLGPAGRGLLAFQGPLVFFPEVFFLQAVVDEVPGEELIGAAFPQGEKIRVDGAFPEGPRPTVTMRGK